MKTEFTRPATAVAFAFAAMASASACAATELKVGVAHAAHDMFISKTDGPEQGTSISAELLSNPIEPLSFVGAARDQVAAVVRAVEAVLGSDPEAAGYRPEPIL